ncbi:2-amino-5-chloromuconate deaminase CnbZ [Microbaculum marinum]|uniref:Uncharacterized protein n=1 Tax=Microbaculum marinum TaxID=1764581 RepID=A0AAW9RBA4_9HYPH
MVLTTEFKSGGYRYVSGVFQYSGGVAALPGHRLVRVRFSTQLPLVEGMKRAESITASQGRPAKAICAFELRSPAPFTEAGFRTFNELYVGQLDAWGVIDGDRNPVARSNVCPMNAPPPEPSVHAFTFAVQGDGPPSAAISGSAEAPEGKVNYRDHIVALGDTSKPALLKKAEFVVNEMERRFHALDFRWSDVTTSQIYSVHNIHPLMSRDLLLGGAARSELVWHFCRPPVVGMEFEMDCRIVHEEWVV